MVSATQKTFPFFQAISFNLLILASLAQEKKAKVVKDEKMGQVKHEDGSQWFS